MTRRITRKAAKLSKGAPKTGRRSGPTRTHVAHLFLLAIGCACAAPGCGAPEQSQPAELGSKVQAIANQPDPSCKAGPAHAGHEYWVCGAPTTFAQARANCQAAGMDLATVDDSAENQYLVGQIGSDSFVGLSDAKTEGVWKWAAENRLGWCAELTLEQQGPWFSNWATNQPARSTCEPVERNGRRYWFCDEHATWEAARQACESANSHLVRVSNEQENSFVQSHLKYNAWLGGSDEGQIGAWRWIDGDQLFWQGGSSGGAVGGAYTNWGSGNPHGGDRCLGMQKGDGGSWFSSPCNKQNGWVCAAPTMVDPLLPDTHDCTTIRLSDGRWQAVDCSIASGYVCESTMNSSPSKRLEEVTEYIYDDIRTGRPRIGHAVFKGSSTVTRPFWDYGERFGMRECTDSLVESGVPRFLPHLGIEAQEYRQVYRGIPVQTRGYKVVRDAATKAARSLSGRFEQNLSVDTKPTVDEVQAFGSALAAIGAKGKDYAPQRPHGELVVYPRKQGSRPEWQLAWLFRLPYLPGRDAYTVVISASTGAVIYTEGSLSYACPSVSIDAIHASNAPETDITVLAFQQLSFGDSPQAKAVELTAPAPNIPLYRKGLDATHPFPEIYAGCSTEEVVGGISLEKLQPAQVAGLDTKSISVSADSTVSLAAAGFTSLQRCVEYFANFSYATGVPWLGYDGTGQIPIVAQVKRLLPSIQTGTQEDLLTAPVFSPNSPGLGPVIYFPQRQNTPPGFPLYGVSVEVACHEFAHGVWTSQCGSEAKEDVESSAVFEGFGDVMGSAAELFGRHPYDWRSLRCFMGDQASAPNDRCNRDLANPALSVELGCRIHHDDQAKTVMFQQCPKDYKGPDYCALADNCTKANKRVDSQGNEILVDCCDSHANATILDHWFHLLVTGDSAENETVCHYEVLPLAGGDPEASVRDSAQKAAAILFDAMRGYYQPGTGYVGMANATVLAAEHAFGAGSNEVKSVVNAWFAVNVRDDNYDGTAITALEPKRDAPSVYPWTTFKWRAEANEDSWDFQLSTGSPPFSYIAYETTATDSTFVNGKKSGTLDLSLPFNAAATYFWRVRPHSSDPWVDCHPINWFVGTTEPYEVKNIAVVGELDDTQVPPLVRPGTVRFRWDRVEGAKKYKLFASTHENKDCASGPDVLEVEVKATVGDSQTGLLSGIQPKETYYLYVRPFGPDQGINPEPGKCIGMQFTTTGMRPPELVAPWDQKELRYGNPVEFSWGAPDGPTVCHIDVFPINSSGSCSALPKGTFQAPCASPYFNAYTADFALVPNPPGYCWRVKSEAANHVLSDPSPQAVFYYYWGAEKQSPGVSQATAYTLFDPAPLPGDSYGSEVTFWWFGSIFAADYVVKLARFPWDGTPVPLPIPGNCTGLDCFNEPSEIVFEEPVATNTYTASADHGAPPENDALGKASKGRYCWTVWPRMAGELQPRVRVSPIFCYTSGPAKPKIEFDPLPEKGFDPSIPITGTITVPYLPNGQGTYSWASTDPAAEFTFNKDDCKASKVCPFANDYYNCIIKFSIPPKEGESYGITFEDYNSGAYPEPVMDSSSKIHTVTEQITAGTCGGPNETCCTQGPKCDLDTLTCVGETCIKCGGFEEICCENEHCDPGHTCVADKCVECGIKGKPCCKEGTPCVGDRVGCWNLGNPPMCDDCGRLGLVCCGEGPACDDGIACRDGWCPCGEAPDRCCVTGNGKEVCSDGYNCVNHYCVVNGPCDATGSTPCSGLKTDCCNGKYECNSMGLWPFDPKCAVGFACGTLGRPVCLQEGAQNMACHDGSIPVFLTFEYQGAVASGWFCELGGCGASQAACCMLDLGGGPINGGCQSGSICIGYVCP